jgi:hypothetical protein
MSKKHFGSKNEQMATAFGNTVGMKRKSTEHADVAAP